MQSCILYYVCMYRQHSLQFTHFGELPFAASVSILFFVCILWIWFHIVSIIVDTLEWHLNATNTYCGAVSRIITIAILMQTNYSSQSFAYLQRTKDRKRNKKWNKLLLRVMFEFRAFSFFFCYFYIIQEDMKLEHETHLFLQAKKKGRGKTIREDNTNIGIWYNMF